MIAAGVNAKALQSFMGHANISITLDRYGHLMPGSKAEAAGLLDAYLSAQRERAEEAARGLARCWLLAHSLLLSLDRELLSGSKHSRLDT